MSKNLGNLNWENVAIEGFPISGASEKFNEFIALEECTDYGFDISKKKSKPNNIKQKRTCHTPDVIPNKKFKVQNGFTVEICDNTNPSLGNEFSINPIIKDKKNAVKVNKHKEKCKKLKNKLRLGETANVDDDNKLLPEDMTAWSQYQIPEEILNSLTEQGFQRPTKIQELTLPSAMLGRRDILGAAETGSGKTLAFGIPILAGIMQLKKNTGKNMYDVPYKKSSAKKKKKTIVEEKPKNKKGMVKRKNKIESEDGYISGSENDEATKLSDNEEYEREIEVPLKKKSDKISADEGNDSDDSEKYVHLSDMINSDDEESTEDLEVTDAGSGVLSNHSDEGSSSQMDNEQDDNNVDLPNHVITKTGKPLYGLILTPTRELAIQISRHLIAAAKYTGIKIAVVVGGMAHVKQERVLSRGPELVVATPGRLWELVQQGQPHLQQLDSVKFLAIDETDRMVERNHFKELHPLLERLNFDETRKCTRQNFVFSATLTLVHDLPTHMKGKKVTKRGKILNRKVEKMTPQQKVKKLVNMIGMTEPKVVDITTQNLGTAETLTECRIACALEHKDYYLYYILRRHPGRTIIFCNSIGSVKRLAQLFGLLHCGPLPLHASMPQRQRLKNLERFRDDPCGVLVATDVAARGLDIPDIDHVIHYQVPRTAENYVHRSGRTARANKEGLTILMMEPGEAFSYAKLCRTLNKQTEMPIFPVPPHVLSSMKETVSLARDVDRLQLHHNRDTQAQGWLDKAAKEMDIIVDDDFLPNKKSTDGNLSKMLQVKKKQLDKLLSKPLFPKGFSFKYPTLNDPDALLQQPQDNALTIMKRALETGSLKKEKRTSKNAPLLQLEKDLKKKLKK